ncbi:MAG: sulfate reduction electron transfer complex DsrMKJOP subunit DsrM [Deltaproteobacteria bacterium]|nr:sulfate reduction electron transfer complex DsrMKJOP subunit DsrM [Deltaproteobacteria bacterium]
MNVLFSLLAVGVLIALGYLGGQVAGLRFVFGVVIPYAAILVFIAGLVYKVIYWAKSPVPFRIPTTCGQETTLPWIKSSTLDNPHTTLGVLGRMALEVLFFRSLFRNTRMEIKEGPRVVYGENVYLWAAGLAFHWSFLIIFIRHFRFFTEPVPGFILAMQYVDGFMQIGVPVLYLTDLFLVAGLTFLFIRRLWSPQLRYISQAADYFPLLLILGVALTGIWMRHFTKTDIVGVKELAMGIVTFSPMVPESVGSVFFMHLILVCSLFAYFPFSKLMHMAGVFLSPTRNLANDNRMVRHVNPWNPEVEVHTYAQWEEEFKDKLEAAEIPLDKD